MKKLSRGGRHAVIFVTSVLVVGIAYYFIHKYTGFGFRCLFRETTGFLCLACGTTHLFMNLFQLKIKEAFECNPVVFFMWPVIGAESTYAVYMGGNGNDLPKWNLALVYIIFAIMMIFGIIRNIG